jgi:hypothetical protein
MKSLFSIILSSMLLFGSAYSQGSKDIRIDWKYSVYGLNITSATVKRDPKSRKVIGVKVDVLKEKKVPEGLSNFECIYWYYDKYGKEIADTTITYKTYRENTVKPYLWIFLDDGDSLEVMNPEYDRILEERKSKDSMERRFFSGFTEYWPAGAVRVKVGIARARYGFTTYYGPGM